MVGAALLLFVMLFGAYCVVGAMLGRVEPQWATIGWVLIILPLFRYQVIFRGLRRAGKIGVAFLIAAVLALVVSGESDLWNLFF